VCEIGSNLRADLTHSVLAAET